MTDPPLRKRLLILSFSPIDSDARVLKQVRHFVTEYEVTTCGYGKAPEGVAHHIRIPDSLPTREHSRRQLVLREYRRIYWQSAAVSFALQALQREPRFDMVLANDVDTVGLALALKPRFGVHADIHEYAPRQNEEIPLWRIFVAPYIRWLCRVYVAKATSVTTVGHGIANEYKRVFGINAGVVTNGAPYVDLVPNPVATPIRMVHSGAALRNRGLESMIHAVARSRTPVTLDLFLMPNDPKYLAELTELAESTAGVTLHPAVPYDDLVGTLNDYDVGFSVIPPVNFSYAWAMPNKFFDYVQARLGIVVGPSPEISQTLEEYELGVSIGGYGSDDIAVALDDLTVAKVSAWKQSAHRAARPLSAELQVAIWDDAISAIGQRSPAAGSDSL